MFLSEDLGGMADKDEKDGGDGQMMAAATTTRPEPEWQEVLHPLQRARLQDMRDAAAAGEAFAAGAG